MTERFLIKADTLTGQVLRLSDLLSALPSVVVSPPHRLSPPPPPATAGIFSSLMDGTMSEFQLWRLKRLVRKLGSDSDRAAFHYSIYHSILHGAIMPPHLAVLFDLGDCQRRHFGLNTDSMDNSFVSDFTFPPLRSL